MNAQLEIERRKAVVAQTDANNKLEGITPSVDNSFEGELRKKWINGEISSHDRVKAIKERYKNNFS